MPPPPPVLPTGPILFRAISPPLLTCAPALGNHIHFGGKGMSARNAFSPTISTGKVYYSFLLKITDLGSLTTSGTAAPFFTAITGGTFVGTAEPSLLVAGVVAKKADTAKYVLGVKKASAGIVYSGNSAGPTTEITNNLGDVVFVVASYEFITGPGNTTTGDKARIWINPDSSTFGGTEPTETVLSTGTADLALSGSPLNGVTIFNRQALFESAAMELDELSVGTTWADVTPTISTVTLAFTTRPVSQRVITGSSVTFNSAGFRATSYKWQLNGVDLPGQTNKTLTHQFRSAERRWQLHCRHWQRKHVSHQQPAGRSDGQRRHFRTIGPALEHPADGSRQSALPDCGQLDATLCAPFCL